MDASEAAPTTCTSTGNCAEPTPYCDTTSGICVQCLTNTNCGDLQCVNNACVECTTDTNCTGFAGRTHCDTATSQCVQCVSSATDASTGDGECAAPTPYCVSDRCVQCSTSMNCATGDVCSNNRCVVACTPDAGQCAAPQPVCNPSTTTCVQCLANTDCTTVVRPVCDLTTDTCVECTSTAGCEVDGGFPVCDTAVTPSRCVECLTSAQCTTTARPVCNTIAHVCVPMAVTLPDAAADR